MGWMPRQNRKEPSVSPCCCPERDSSFRSWPSFLAPHEQVRGVRVELRRQGQQGGEVQVHLLQEREAVLGVEGVHRVRVLLP